MLTDLVLKANGRTNYGTSPHLWTLKKVGILTVPILKVSLHLVDVESTEVDSVVGLGGKRKPTLNTLHLVASLVVFP
jgi:hypothetical protein